MPLSKQAKILTKPQANAVLGYLETTRYPTRNQLIFLLSLRAGLRAKEIASLTWDMVTDAEGELLTSIQLTNVASKGRSGGRVIPMSRDLQAALSKWKEEAAVTHPSSAFIITSERGGGTSAQAIVNKFQGWYRALGFRGASSHSGRRTAITSWARQISTVGGSLRDVQVLAGHSALSTTQRYIETDAEAQRKVVNI